MRTVISVLTLFVLLISLTGCAPAEEPAAASSTTAEAEETLPPTTLPETLPTEPETTAPTAPVLELTEEEQTLLLKIGMAELGTGDCTECIALVMRTVLNRVESSKFSSTIRGVLYAPEQFTPVCDGSFNRAVPNERCYEALDMVIHGWDESQGALYYEFCEGESWHSKNLNLLFQHCSCRFYN